MLVGPSQRLLLLSVLLAGTDAWLTTSQEQGDSSALDLDLLASSNGAINRIWYLPEAAREHGGLGGGISFAYDEERICGDLLPAFSESANLWGASFIDCGSIKAAIRSAFASWTSNHPMLKFHDVTQDCNLAGDTTGGPMGIGCSKAEIWLTTTSNGTAQDAAATTLNDFRWASDFKHPNGVRAVPGLYKTVGSVIRFSNGQHSNAGICWYMDSSFCSGFHSLKAKYGAETVLLVGKLIMFVVWGLGIAWGMYKLISSVKKTYVLLSLELKKASPALRKRVAKLVDEVDKNDDGSLSRDEIIHLLVELSKGNPNAEECAPPQRARGVVARGSSTRQEAPPLAPRARVRVPPTLARPTTLSAATARACPARVHAGGRRSRLTQSSSASRI